MVEAGIDFKAAALWLLGALLAVVSWLGRQLNARVRHLEETAMKKEDFDKAMAEFREERRAMNAENRSAMQAMHEENRQTLRDIHTRVDDIWKHNWRNHP